MKRSKRRESPEGLVILFAGDVHGHWDLLARHGDVALARHGRLDGIICVGDAEAFRSKDELEGMCAPSKYRVLGSFPKVISGKIKLAAPVWFIGGNHEPWPALDENGPGEWIPGVNFLGRAGASEVLGLKTAFLSGIYSPVVSEWGDLKKRSNTREMTYFSGNDVEKTMRVGKEGAVDLLLTHEWPAGIGTNKRGEPAGAEQITDIDRRLRPRLHVCGHMHHRISTKLGDTRVEALGHIRSGGDGSCVVEWGAEELIIHPPLPIRGLPRE